jgi:hypothetical protein
MAIDACSWGGENHVTSAHHKAPHAIRREFLRGAIDVPPSAGD